MPELPEVTLYVESLDRLLGGEVLGGIRLRSPSLLRTWDPRLSEAEGRRIEGFRRIGKRVVWELEGDLFLVFHLMVTGRFHWKKPAAAVPRKNAHAAFDFDHGSLLLTEAGTKKKATLHVVRGEEALEALDPGGIEPLESDLEAFRDALLQENHTLKRALTDPRLLSGIGNAHSDEILLEAGLSPVQRTQNLSDEEVENLWRVTRESLATWVERLREEVGEGFPERVTAFHPAMKAHGKFGDPCPRCGTTIQRIVYTGRETHYCPTCQTGGRLLADRALSRLLKEDWPRTVEELEEMTRDRSG
ncbi:MAG: DNA-formamidopyrimidine glycosylase family protein [Longimicrobiales bacterium]